MRGAKHLGGEREADNDRLRDAVGSDRSHDAENKDRSHDAGNNDCPHGAAEPMLCRHCGGVMEHGTASIMPTMGFSPLSLSFTADSEAAKGLLRRKSQGAVVLPGDEAEAYYCPHCGVAVTEITVR